MSNQSFLAPGAENYAGIPVTIERIYNAPVEKVWQALTDKDKMKKWYFDLTEFHPVVGFEFRFYGKGHKGDQYLHLCRIIEVIDGRKLSYSWCYEGLPGNSKVTFELFPEGDKTKLRLTHEGIDSFASENPDFAKESFMAGWTELIGKSLKDFLEN